VQGRPGQILHYFVTDHTQQESEDFNGRQLCVDFLGEDTICSCALRTLVT